MYNYLLIKTAADRFNIPESITDAEKGALQGIGNLANKAGLPPHEPIDIKLYSKNPEIAKQMAGAAMGFNAGKTIGIDDDFLGLIDKNGKPFYAVSPLIALHEYGHTFDNAIASNQFRGFLRKFMPETAYRLFRNDYEQGADDSARLLINYIDDEKDRKELMHTYNRFAKYNEMVNKVMRPQHLGYAVGSLTGGAIGAAGGGYLGYKGTDKLIRYFDKNTQRADYTPTISHRLANLTGAALLGTLGAHGGSYLGCNIGDYIGSKFVDQKKLQKAKNLGIGIVGQRAVNDLANSYSILGKYRNA